MVHASERLIKDLEAKMSEDDKNKLTAEKDELDKAIKENFEIDKIKTLSDALQQTMFSISSAAYQQTEGEGQPEGSAEGGEAPAGEETTEASAEEKSAEEDVIDAEFSK